MARLRIALLVAALGGALSGSSRASVQATLFGVNRINEPNKTNELVRIDPASGVGSTVGDIGFALVLGLAANQSGQLFGVDDGTKQLISIDPLTGAGSPIGSTGLTAQIAGLTFNAAGTLYGVTNSSELVTINTSSGVASFVRSVDARFGISLAFDPLSTPDRLIGAFADDSLVAIDPTPAGLDNEVASSGFDVTGALAFDDSGQLFGVDSDGKNSSRLVRIAPDGTRTDVGPTGFVLVEGIAFLTSASAMIPEPTAACVWLGLLGSAFACRRG